eukprot:scaffold1762_cov383-Prasinococcus_capsulatus_cf.AAC.10
MQKYGVYDSPKSLRILICHERHPTMSEGGHRRLLQFMHFFRKQGHHLILVHRDQKSQLKPVQHEALLNMGVKVYIDDTNMTTVTPQFIREMEVDILFFPLWFYNPTYLHTNMAHTLLPRFSTPETKGNLRIIMKSDDQHWLRARQIGAARGDPPGYWEELRAVGDELLLDDACMNTCSSPRSVEAQIYASPELDLLISITEDDRQGHEALRERMSNSMYTGPPTTVSSLSGIQEVNAGKGWVCRTHSWRCLCGQLANLDRAQPINDSMVLDQVLPMIATKTPYKKQPFSTRWGVLFLGSGAFHNRLSVQWLLKTGFPEMFWKHANSSKADPNMPLTLTLCGAPVWPRIVKEAQNNKTLDESTRTALQHVHVCDDGRLAHGARACLKACARSNAEVFKPNYGLFASASYECSHHRRSSRSYVPRAPTHGAWRGPRHRREH